jgi:MoaA/NifB/PqqE/SkfB family radical SAM enzyme
MKRKIKSLKKSSYKVIKELAQDYRYRVLYDHKLPELYEKLVKVKNKTVGTMIRLEASSVCQLKCPACSTAKGKNRKGVIGWGFLTYKNFKKLIEENPHIKTIELSNWGEIFLNPELDNIIKFAHKHGVGLKAANGVNLNTVNDETLRNVVKYGFRLLSISIDGASQDTYKLYRKKGSFNRVIRNIKRINFFKEKYKTNFPKMNWQFVIFGHNEHELPIARQMSEDLNMEFRPKLNHTPIFSPVNNENFVRKEGGFGVASRTEFAKKRKRAYSRPCTQLWDSPQINWDGKLLGCCVNKFGDFGNVFETSFKDCMSSEKYLYAKRMVLGLEPSREDIPCVHCKVYKTQIAGELFDKPSPFEAVKAVASLSKISTRKIIELLK